MATPGAIRAVTPCVVGSPRSTTVTVQASDPSGIASVVLTVGGPSAATIAMDPVGGGTYQATVGPMPGTPNEPTLTVPLTATATDGAGNVARSRGSFVLRCVSPTNP